MREIDVNVDISTEVDGNIELYLEGVRCGVEMVKEYLQNLLSSGTLTEQEKVMVQNIHYALEHSKLTLEMEG